MTLKKLIYKFFTTGLSLVWLMVSGQNSTPYVEARLGADSIYLGSQTSLVFTIASPDNYTWQWPEIGDKITEKIEIINQTAIDTTKQRRSDLVLLRKHLTITSFDTGFHAIPRFQFQFKSSSDTLWTTLETEPFLLYVAGPEVDLGLPIRDIKGPLKAPLTYMEVLPWLLIVILIAAGLLLYRYYLQKKKSRLPLLPKPAKPKIPPHTRALDALEELRRKKLWQNGKIKEYHSEITDILRHYIEERYGIMAVEMTTSEIMEAAHKNDLPSQARGKLQEIFERADLVKFAKSVPLPDEHEKSFMLSVDFVRSTIPLAANSGSQQNLDENITENMTNRND